MTLTQGLLGEKTVSINCIFNSISPVFIALKVLGRRRYCQSSQKREDRKVEEHFELNECTNWRKKKEAKFDFSICKTMLVMASGNRLQSRRSIPSSSLAQRLLLMSSLGVWTSNFQVQRGIRNIYSHPCSHPPGSSMGKSHSLYSVPCLHKSSPALSLRGKAKC